MPHMLRLELTPKLAITILLFCLIQSAAAADSRKEQRIALVIGNSNYSDVPLKNPGNDATDMAAALEQSGFTVLLRVDATQREMKEAIREFSILIQQGGTGLFYYAGHGLQVKGRNFLVPVGADITSETEVEYEAVDAGRILSAMEDAGNDLNIVILDACRNNPYARSFRSTSRGLARMDAPSGSIVAYSTAPGSVAADGIGRNGTYTKNLLRFITEPGQPIETMLKKVAIAVVEETEEEQVPWVASSLLGEFAFRGDVNLPPESGLSIAEKEKCVNQAKMTALVTGMHHYALLLPLPASSRITSSVRQSETKLIYEVSKQLYLEIVSDENDFVDLIGLFRYDSPRVLVRMLGGEIVDGRISLLELEALMTAAGFTIGDVEASPFFDDDDLSLKVNISRSDLTVAAKSYVICR